MLKIVPGGQSGVDRAALDFAIENNIEYGAFPKALNHHQIRIRLNCIDAPEKSQDFGQRSKRSLIDLIAGEYVIVQKYDVERYGRTIGTI